jgi:excinuclease ABC subunit A
MIEAAAVGADATHIHLRGVRQNNLKGIDVDIPLGKLTVVTGLSGSGKSSLVFETLHAEGQRRYVETFSAYTRQFLDLLDKPDVDSVTNIRPSIAIQQSNTVKTSRSTVGTMTELCDYFKVWFHHHSHCYDPETGERVVDEYPEVVWDRLEEKGVGGHLLICFRLRKPDSLAWSDVLQPLQGQGYSRVLIAGEVVKLEGFVPDAAMEGSLVVVQDRLRLEPEQRSRFLDSVATAQHFGGGEVEVYRDDGTWVGTYSRGLHSARTGRRFRDKSVALFSFNSPIGACPKCRGFGRVIEIDYGLVIPDRNLSIDAGAIRAFSGEVYQESLFDLQRACRKKKIPTNLPWKDMGPDQVDFVMEGEPGYQQGDFDRHGHWYGVRRFFEFLEQNTYKMHVRVFLSKYRSYVNCPACGGARLQPEALNWKWEGYRLPDLYELPVRELHELLLDRTSATGNPQVDSAREAILNRLSYLNEVGLGYLTLNRSSRTLSGGEVERVNLTACLGTRLTDTLFVLDEPSVGLHARDIARLIRILKLLTDLGNTVVLVEHDESVMRAADHLIEIGPRPGREGGNVVFAGPYAAMLRHEDSITGAYLSGRMKMDASIGQLTVDLPRFPLALHERKKQGPLSDQPLLRIRGASKHNLDSLDMDVPLERLVCITGVSGSGKSTLLNHVIYQGLMQRAGRIVEEVATFRQLEIDCELDLILVDQSAISRTPRSNPALFVDAWEGIRKLFAATESAKAMGFSASEFSFNSGDGRCQHCQGLGYEKVEMQFLSDVFVKCPVCEGKRFKHEVLQVTWQGHSIADVLGMDIEQAVGVFAPAPKVASRLQVLVDVGLGYLQLGQPLNTLSGGESQRLKLVSYLNRMGEDAKPTLLLLDEPTTGLHRHDVKVLMGILRRIVAQGHSLLVIEHHLDVIAAADWVIEMGPEAGRYGGRLVAAGEPDWIAQQPTVTGPFLRQLNEAPRMDAEALLAAEEGGSYGSRSSQATRVATGVHPRGCLSVFGAREHNLQNLDVHIPNHAITVVTGVSGSGKSSLAFDIIFAEGQRRFMESMSSYARQFVEQLPRPDIDELRGIAPTVAIEQRVTRGSRKSTVATITEVAQYLRLLYARIGVQHSPKTGEAVVALPFVVVQANAEKLVRQWLKAAPASSQLLLGSPVIRGRKGHHQPLANWAAERGYEWMRCDGELVRVAAFEKLNRYQEHDVEVFSRMLPAGATEESIGAFVSGMKEADRIGKGSFFLLTDRNRMLGAFSTSRIDPATGMAFPELDPKHFSWNSSRGWCPTCHGYGKIYSWLLEEEEGLPKSLAGLPDGTPCPECKGDRLNELSRHVKLYFKDGSSANLPQLLKLTSDELLQRLQQLQLDARSEAILTDIYPQIRERLQFMGEVGIEYLSLDRETATLSGGEAQRIRLASQLGTNLTGVLYVLDEPSIGLHPQDNERLILSLEHLREKGNTLIVVEHDEDMMRRSDYLIDLGPGAGVHGGRILAQGTPAEVMEHAHSLTGRYLSQGIRHPLKGAYRALPEAVSGKKGAADEPGWLVLRHANLRNLKGDDLYLPLGRLTMVCGVSGAGKSTLIRDLLMPALNHAIQQNLSVLDAKVARSANLFVETKGPKLLDYPFAQLLHADAVNKVIEMDQSPIGKTPRSNPATYIGIFDTIRQLFAATPEAKMKGLDASTFSFNTAKGRCEACGGAGRMKLEMGFMPDTYVDCETCGGTRYNEEIREIRWNGKSIVDVLNMPFEEALAFFDFHSGLKAVMELMVDTGLGYIRLGQSSPTLSGGEAQRMKLVSELTKGVASYKDRSRGILRNNLYILEEPTIGLHQSDCEKLVLLLHKLVDQGHTVVVIEHHLDLIAEADYVVEVGPGSGEAGGRILFQGPVEPFMKGSDSPTAPFLRKLLDSGSKT